MIVKECGTKCVLAINLGIALQLKNVTYGAHINAIEELQTSNYSVIKDYIESYRQKLDDDIAQSQKYQFRIFLIPKIGNHADSSDHSFGVCKCE